MKVEIISDSIIGFRHDYLIVFRDNLIASLIAVGDWDSVIFQKCPFVS